MENGNLGSLPKEVWVSGGAYENYVGRWSRAVAPIFLEWLAIPPGSAWLDVGCGTAALTQAVLETAAPRSVKGVDSAEGFISYANTKITDRRAAFQLGDAQALPVETGACDAAISGFVINFVARPDQMVQEMARSVRPGGVAALYVWDYADRMQFMRHFWNAAAALDPAAAELDEGRRFPLCGRQPLVDLFQRAGLTAVDARPIDIWTVFKNFDDYWSPFLGGQGSAPTYLMSLAEQRRTALREKVRASLPFAIDGSIPLIARAWAVRGVR